MIPDGERFSRRQLLSVCFVGLLSPLMRQLPRAAALSAGNAGWLCGLASFPLLALFALLLRRLTRRRAAGEGPGELFLRVYGKGLGAAVLGVYALWLLAYAGFVIAAGAERLATTVYPRGGRLVFLLTTAGLGFVAALSRARTLARAANVLRPLLLITLLALLTGGLLGGDGKSLLPVTAADAFPVLRGGAYTADVLLLAAAFAFLLPGVEPEGGPGPMRELLRLGAMLALLSTLLTAAVLSAFGPDFTLSQAHPFLAMTRDLRLPGTVERLDALVVGLWVLADFVQLAALLLAARTILRLLLRSGTGRLPGLLCAGAALGFALLCGGRAEVVDWLGGRFFPASGAVVAGAVWPATLAVGVVRGRI